MASMTATATRRPPLIPWPGRALAAVAVAVAVMLVLGILAWHKDHGFAVDAAFRRWVLRTFDLYTTHDMLRLTAPWVIVLGAGVVAGLALLARRIDLAVLSVAAPLAATGLTEYVLKPIFDRTVPPTVVQMHGIEVNAYPSGHETAVSSVLVLLVLILLRARLPLLIKAIGLLMLATYFVVTVIALVGQAYHYLSDTIGALGVATAVVLGGALAIDRILSSPGVPDPSSTAHGA